MKRYAYSETLNKTYPLSDTVRILNIRQALFYLQKNIELYDIYPSKDFNTGEPVLVFIFAREQSKSVYEEWKNGRDTKPPEE